MVEETKAGLGLWRQGAASEDNPVISAFALSPLVSEDDNGARSPTVSSNGHENCARVTGVFKGRSGFRSRSCGMLRNSSLTCLLFKKLVS